MNLTTDPWLPVVFATGHSDRVSLGNAFARAHEIRDLALRPHERIAVMRLLLCITHAALGGPANRKEWRACRDRIAPAVAAYLAKPEIYQSFALFGNGPRFLQVTDLKLAKMDDDQGTATTKLDFSLATGDNPTLFDNTGGSARSSHASAHALSLLTFQCFSPSGTIGVGLWGGKPTLNWASFPKPAAGTSIHAPCLSGNMLHTLLRGSSLLESLHLNLLNKELVAQALGDERWGRPIWEQMPASATDHPADENATCTYLGRLVPLARAVRLSEDGQSLQIANGLAYLAYDQFRESAATIITRSDGEKRAVLGASLDRAPWRELHALTVRRFAQGTTGGPLALDNLNGDEAFDIWVGAVVAAGNNKILDTLESVFSHVPASLLEDTGRSIYDGGVKYSEGTARLLCKAVFIYHKKMGDKLDRPDAKTRRDLLYGAASARFWTEAEQGLSLLFALVADATELGLKDNYAETHWGCAIRQAARRAYEQACPRETSRQMQAYVIGLKQLIESKPETVNA